MTCDCEQVIQRGGVCAAPISSRAQYTAGTQT